ncbi:MAG: MGMT family protein, partial [Senegalimassilia anaerobia]|nr:MGMT family protein [Senegalimassilia anaerobia]
QRVWKLLADIPYGELRTYAELAAQIACDCGGKASARAVGTANGRNPISIILPCHRVIGSDGSLTGYAGGIARKAWLLEHEGADLTGLYVPKRGTAL